MPTAAVESLHVAGASFFPELHMEFSDGLNCIVGGTGAGKTSVLHLLRFVLGAEMPIDAKLRARAEKQIKHNLGHGTVTVRIRTTHGVRFTCTRSAGRDPILTTERGELSALRLAEVFPAAFYAPQEVERVASSPPAQLALLDGCRPAEIRRANEEIERNLRALDANAEQLLAVEREIEDYAGRTAHLVEMEEQLAGLETLPGIDPDEAARARVASSWRDRERTALEVLLADMGKARDAFDAFAIDALARVTRGMEPALADGPRGALFTRAHAAVTRAVEAIERARTDLAPTLGAVHAELQSVSLAVADHHRPEDDAFRQLLARHEQDAERSARRESLRAEVAQLSRLRWLEREKRQEHARLSRMREGLLDERRAASDARFALREDIARWIKAQVGDTVHVAIKKRSDGTKYRELLTELLPGRLFTKDLVAQIANIVPPDDLVRAARTDDTSLLAGVDALVHAGVERMRLLLQILIGTERLYAIETVEIADVPILGLTAGPDNFIPSESLSSGESCACVLPLVLMRADAPLFLDQPEDNVDNVYVFFVLVKSLARVKTHRQVFVVTHNANIPMLGAADRVFEMASLHQVGRVARVGTPQELAAALEHRLEGGSEAFLQRAARYGHMLASRATRIWKRLAHKRRRPQRR